MLRQESWPRVERGPSDRVRRGAAARRVVPPRPIPAEDFERAYPQTAKSDLLWQLFNRVYFADSPTEL